MKTFKRVTLALLGVMMAFGFANAQDYKHSHGLVKEDGKVLDSAGTHLGWVTKTGEIKDASGTKIAQIDKEGNLLDAKTGKNLGKAEKNGNFVYHFSATADDKLIASEPMSGTCEVKDSKGKVIVVVHENYKQSGSCAYHCLSMKKAGHEMHMK